MREHFRYFEELLAREPTEELFISYTDRLRVRILQALKLILFGEVVPSSFEELYAAHLVINICQTYHCIPEESRSRFLRNSAQRLSGDNANFWGRFYEVLFAAYFSRAGTISFLEFETGLSNEYDFVITDSSGERILFEIKTIDANAGFLEFDRYCFARSQIIAQALTRHGYKSGKYFEDISLSDVLHGEQNRINWGFEFWENLTAHDGLNLEMGVFVEDERTSPSFRQLNPDEPVISSREYQLEDHLSLNFRLLGSLEQYFEHQSRLLERKTKHKYIKQLRKRDDKGVFFLFINGLDEKFFAVNQFEFQSKLMSSVMAVRNGMNRSAELSVVSVYTARPVDDGFEGCIHSMFYDEYQRVEKVFNCLTEATGKPNKLSDALRDAGETRLQKGLLPFQFVDHR